MNCPWSTFKPSEIDFCEENVCEWIREPASSYSCLAYIIFGVLILSDTKNLYTYLFAIISICIGIFSFVFHASLTFLGSILDLGSMYLLATLLLFINIRRFTRFTTIYNNSIIAAYFVGSNSFLLVYTYFFEQSTGIFYLFLMITVLALEVLHLIKNGKKTSFKWLYFALAGYIGGSVFWYFDTYRIYCDPSNHLVNGHVIWHFMSAFAVFSIYKYYSQIIDS